ncbi:uncharacterized protein LOC109712506 [Ananas comosus]|uniref:Uncharacterized protein LOC109712506 n=1 Tax=Ananas comosus TaxID=4615 RepID=A0A6P5FEE9_ANACO|nr:uncharacterized protein LOC109712506 [Ananas comosus]XP_020091685.1 uncharacterized protein LOC109712506 [Ananas comosus]XP_020091687.1 uncharacterized protein LOC109712506 [Ananas comosus]XP_020091688.1 uncharacterized protein LOC109712506 [Ananas comosus]XP_020091689.1 uncharacterized protein LOC109712506 [Ananas comosus]XP_020091690.1 uncharacterized protein LOC109712506 [Ananas comosus]
MAHGLLPSLLSLPFFFLVSLALTHSLELKELKVGNELEGESLPLNMGHRVYKVTGLKKSVWYEVKISYPASIPASFSIQLKREAPELWLNKNRRLLNTEKLIFKADSFDLVYVQVTVETAGVVAQPNSHEREVILFNIVCDELVLGIPHNAWWVGTAAILCLAFAALIPHFLPLDQWLKYKSSQSNGGELAKVS